jgi:hypothetical protein
MATGSYYKQAAATAEIPIAEECIFLLYWLSNKIGKGAALQSSFTIVNLQPGFPLFISGRALYPRIAAFGDICPALPPATAIAATDSLQKWQG